MALEDLPDARGRQVDAQNGELTVDPPVAPGRVLPGQAGHELHGSRRNRRPSRQSGVGPLPTDQFPVPAQQGVGLHEEATELGPGDEPCETGKERPVRRPQGRAGHLATEDRHLVAKHDDLNGEIGVVTSSETDQLERPDEGEIQERECHGSFWRPPRP